MNLDYVYRVHDFPKPGETITAISQSVNPGGKGLNQSVALAKAGAQVYHACLKGIGGDMLVDTLQRNKVNVDNVLPCDFLQGNAVICVNDAGENNIVLFGGSNRSLTEEQIVDMLNRFEAGDWLLLQNEVNLLSFIIEKAYERNMKIVLNPSPCDEKIKKIDFSKLSMIFVNEVEGEQLTGETEPEKILAALSVKYPGLQAVLTLGSAGAYYSDGERLVFQESFPVNVIDTTAAGDTFSGYFLARFMNGDTIEQSMYYAAKAASIAVGRAGACDSIPVWAEVCEDELMTDLIRKLKTCK